MGVIEQNTVPATEQISDKKATCTVAKGGRKRVLFRDAVGFDGIQNLPRRTDQPDRGRTVGDDLHGHVGHDGVPPPGIHREQVHEGDEGTVDLVQHGCRGIPPRDDVLQYGPIHAT